MDEVDGRRSEVNGDALRNVIKPGSCHLNSLSASGSNSHPITLPRRSPGGIRWEVFLCQRLRRAMVRSSVKKKTPICKREAPVERGDTLPLFRQRSTGLVTRQRQMTKRGHGLF